MVSQSDDSIRTGVRVSESSKLQHGRHVRAITGAVCAHAGAISQIILAIRQLQTALQQVSRIVTGFVEAGERPTVQTDWGYGSWCYSAHPRQRAGSSPAQPPIRACCGRPRFPLQDEDGGAQNLWLRWRLRPCRSCRDRRSCGRRRRQPLHSCTLSISAAVRLLAQIGETRKNAQTTAVGGITVRLIQSPLAY